MLLQEKNIYCMFAELKCRVWYTELLTPGPVLQSHGTGTGSGMTAEARKTELGSALCAIGGRITQIFAWLLALTLLVRFHCGMGGVSCEPGSVPSLSAAVSGCRLCELSSSGCILGVQ